MPVLKSNIDIKSTGFIENYKHNTAIHDSIGAVLETSMNKRDEKLLKKHAARGKLLVRERIAMLIDEDSQFLEFSPLAAIDQYDNNFPGAGIVTGVGYIHGRETIVIANDATVKGGTYIKETIKKHLRAQDIAMQNHLPLVYLVDSGGIFLPEQANVYPDKEHFGKIFFNQAKLSAERIPQVAVVMGSCTAGGAYIPAMSDESIIVKGSGTIFLAGPSLVEAATGEVVSAEELGGAEVHTKISGVADHLAENDEEALLKCREIFETLQPSAKQELDIIASKEPLYSPEEIYGLIPKNLKKGIDMYEVIARLVDDSEFKEFKTDYGKTIVTGFARIHGYPVGIVASNGIIFSESSNKATHFIQLCSSRNIPLVFLQNISGFMVGKEYEHKGIAKDGAKMIHAVANANVPKFTVIIGASSGAGNYAMAGRAFEPNLLFTWPNSKTSVMGGKQASEVLFSIKRSSIGNHDLNNPECTKRKIRQEFEKESSALYSTSRIWDDGIIDPADTREVLAMGISMSLNRPFPEPKTGVYRM